MAHCFRSDQLSTTPADCSTKMTSRERAARARFEIPLELNGSLFFGEFQAHHETPGLARRCVPAMSRVVRLKT
jgi:hypothetical protein